MPRFSWAAWGLLVVVLDLPLRRLGRAARPRRATSGSFIGLAGGAALHPAFARARVAALVGIPASVVTGTPLFLDQATGAAC